MKMDYRHEQSPRSLYAIEKVKTVKDLEVEVMAAAPPHTKAKVVVLGDSGVGKTSIIYRHQFGHSESAINTTIGASFVTCDVFDDADGDDIQLQIWDTAGQERFRCMVPMYMRNAAAAVIVYDVTCRASFDNVDKWLAELHKCCGVADPVLVLVGNKTDLASQREVARGEGITKAIELNARFYEVSSTDPDMFAVVLGDLAGDLTSGHHKLALLQEKAAAEVNLVSPKKNDVIKLDEKKHKCCSLL